jgi:LAS superfamily LD-carboxypeptidase LdcB
MRNFLTLIFTALLLFLIAELGFYLYLTKTQKPANTTNKSDKSYSSNQSSFQLSLPQTQKSISGEELTSVYAKVKQYNPDNKTIIFVDANNQEYQAFYNQNTLFLTQKTKIVNGRPLRVEKREPVPFSLLPENIYWFQWQANQKSKNNLSLVKISRLQEK